MSLKHFKYFLLQLLLLLASNVYAITLTLIGNNPDFTIESVDYFDPGATTTSTETINISKNNFDVDTIGRYEIIYTATDTQNNIVDTITRTVYVVSGNRLDIDNNGKVRANQDGVMIWHYLLGGRDENYIKRAVGKNAKIATPSVLIAYVKYLAENNFLDIDDDNKINSKDGAIILRYLLGVRGNALTSSLNLTGTRTLAASITNYFKNILTPLTWRKATNEAQWPARTLHSSVAFKNKMWVTGGSDGDNKKDVWSSKNGASWREVTATIPWSERSGHSSVVFKNEIILAGGSFGDDVWSSADGIIWATKTDEAEWTHRSDHSSVVFKNKIWILGGNTGRIFLNDVWSSTDGMNWRQASITSAASWSARESHSSVVWRGKIWVLGGQNNDFQPLNDVWFSNNASATIWRKATETMGPKWSARSYHSSVVWRDKIWVFGGENSDSELLNDVWSSSDGVHWQKHPRALWSKRHYHSVIVFKNKIWLLGGRDNGGRKNDVWFFGD